jgi:hypothetical protein
VDAVSEIEMKSFDKPDETRPFEGKGWVDMVTVAGKMVSRGQFEPGWRWSTNIKPIAGTDSCQVSHFGYCVAGGMRVRMDDGTERELAPGELVAIPPGHDAEVIGNETCVFLDFGEVDQYAMRR